MFKTGLLVLVLVTFVSAKKFKLKFNQKVCWKKEENNYMKSAECGDGPEFDFEYVKVFDKGVIMDQDHQCLQSDDSPKQKLKFGDCANANEFVEQDGAEYGAEGSKRYNKAGTKKCIDIVGSSGKNQAALLWGCENQEKYKGKYGSDHYTVQEDIAEVEE